jgi:hypothetical protein
VRLVVDALSDTVARVADASGVHTLDRALLPAGVREGDVLELHVTIDREATAAARDATQARRDALSQDDDGGDFSL